MRRLLTFACAALFAFSCGSLATADVVTQYQWNPTGDWFALPQVPPTGTSQVTLTSISNIQQNGSIYNYSSSTPIANGILNDAAEAISGVSGPGLNFMVQNGGSALATFRLRGNVGRFNVENGSASTGMTVLGWSSAPVTTLAGLNYALSVGPAGGNPAGYQQGFRLAIQDESNNWYLSNSASGTVTGRQDVDLANETWAAYTPADLSSTSLATFDAGAATFNAFGGNVKNFGFFFQQTNETAFRLNGFQVTNAVPEPGSVAVLGLISLGLFSRRRR